MKSAKILVGVAWVAAWLGVASAEGGGFVVDRQGAWRLVQDGAGAVKTLSLERDDGGVRTVLATVEVPSATVTNSYWDEYAGRDEATGRAVGGMVTRVDTVAADYRFTAFVNDNNVYWEDWADGTARLWTAPCETPGEKMLLETRKSDEGPLGCAFGATPWQRGAKWRAEDGKGAVAWEDGTKRTLSERDTARRASPKYPYTPTGPHGDGDYELVAFHGNGGYQYWTSLGNLEYLPDAAEYYEVGESYGDASYWNAFERENHAFAGWYTSATGGSRVADATLVDESSPKELFAHWSPWTDLGDALDDNSLAFTTGGNAPWFGQTLASHDGADAARSGAILNGQSTWLETTVTGPGIFSFFWKTFCAKAEENWTSARLLVDGQTKTSLAGKTDWEKEVIHIGVGDHTIRWQFTKNRYWEERSGVCTWVDQVEWKPFSVAEQTVAFDANGGVCGMATAIYPVGKTYGSLPVATRDGYAFSGWYTDKGERVESTSYVEPIETVTLHARWAKFTDGMAIAVNSVRQRFPWNGLVDIDYELFLDEQDNSIWIRAEATDVEHSRALRMETLSGDGATAPIKAGRHRMTWNAKADNPGAHSNELTVKMKGSRKEWQTISFETIGAQITTNRVALSATATSGGTVTFKVVSGPGIIEGDILTFTGSGTVVVKAEQAGDARWLPEAVTQTLVVAKAAQAISFATVGPQTTTDQVELVATATGGGEVVFEVVSGPGKVEGNMLTFPQEGTVVVRAAQIGDDIWLPSTSTQTVVVINTYMLVDLSAECGDAAMCPVSYLVAEPEGGWTYEYKTTKLVLRRIETGTFLMSGQTTTLTKPYYMGVFEVTQMQWGLVMGASFYERDARPQAGLSYNSIRGSSTGARWPANNEVDEDSFLGQLRAKTGLEFDLPTEAQWEYACRAGTTSTYNNGGDTEDDLKQLGRYPGNQDDGKGGYSGCTTVGSYLPNAWGLYDMHGNVFEWCLDWFGSLASDATDPKGATSGSERVRRGGAYTASTIFCASGTRYHAKPSDSFPGIGFRLAMILSE